MDFSDLAFFRVLRAFYRSTNTCSAESHALMYSVAASTVLIAVGGFYVWRRFIKTKPSAEMCVG
jgi:hypothetical protein